MTAKYNDNLYYCQIGTQQKWWWWWGYAIKTDTQKEYLVAFPVCHDYS